MGQKEEELNGALKKAKELEKETDLYTVDKLKKEDSQFMKLAKGLLTLLSKFPRFDIKKSKIKKTKAIRKAGKAKKR